MLYREIIAICSQIHTKHINTLRGQNVEFLNAKLAVDIVTTGLKVVTISSQHVTQTDQHFCYPIYLPRSHTLQPARLFFAVARLWKGEIVSVCCMKVYRGGRGVMPLILIHLGTDGERPPSRAGRFAPGMDDSRTVFLFPTAARVVSLRRNVGTSCGAHQPTHWSPGAWFLETKWRTRKTNRSSGMVPKLRVTGAAPPLSHKVRD
jgi:hypothetical protein